MSFSNDFRELMRFEDQAEKCLKCGLCLYQCTVYREEHNESFTSRNRNRLITELVSKEADFTNGSAKELAYILSFCVGCNKCTTTCPAGIHADELIFAFKADLVRTRGLPFLEKASLRWLMPRRRIYALSLKLASRFQWLLPKYDGGFNHLPFFLPSLAKGRYVPHIAYTPLLEQLPEVISPPEGVEVKMRVGLFVGCSTNFFWPEIGKSMISFLVKNGIEVVIPKEQGCCGMPQLGVGDFETARALADNAVRVFKDLDFVITGCATGGHTLKYYKTYLADTEERTKSYGEFSTKVRDFSEFLVDDLKLPETAYKTLREKNLRVTYHDPCHLNRYQNVAKQPRKILQSINGLDLVEMDRADDCCGMDGTFSINHYQTSQQILEHKIESIKKTNADVVVANCPGGMIQIQDGLLRHKMPQKVLHLAQLLDGEI